MITLSITLSGQCNLSCSYCYFKKNNISFTPISLDNFFLEYQKFKSAIPDKETIRIDFFGGEPLIHWDLIKLIINTLKDDGNDFLIPTNGLLLTADKIDFINEHKIKISLSFDGLWQNNNRLTPKKEKTLSSLLKKKDLVFKINDCTIHTMISGECNNLLENHLYILDVFGISPGMELIKDIGAWSRSDVLLFNKGFSELINWYILNVDNYPIPPIILHHLRDFIRAFAKKSNPTYCGAGKSHFSYLDGRIIPCFLLRNKDVIGQIPNYTNMTGCASCEIIKFCRRGCLHENINNKGPIAELCLIYKHIYNDISRMVASLKDSSKFCDLIQRELYDA